MEKRETNWMNNPTKKQVILFTALWFVGNFLLVISLTDLFRENFFQQGSFMIYSLMTMSTVTIVKQHLNYLKHKTKSASTER